MSVPRRPLARTCVPCSVQIAAGMLTAVAAALPQGALAQTAVYAVVPDTAADPLLANLKIPADAASAGMWSAVADWPIVAIHASLLPDGRVMTFGAAPGGTVQDGRTLVFWNPRKGLSADAFQVLPNAQNVDSFCGAATLLSDGRLLTSGGASYTTGYSSRESMVVDWKTSTPTRDYDLTAQRWYATLTKLPDGRAIITGGGAPYASADPDRPDAANDISSTPEVYTPGQGWRSLIGAYSTDAFGAKNARWWYPRQWVSPAGTLFGISTDRMWEMGLTGNGTIRTVGAFKTAPNATTRPNNGPTSSAVMYDAGKILQIGGNGYFNGYNSASSAAATIVDINGIGTGKVTVTDTAPMAYARQWANSTVLPNGRVLVTGGSAQADLDGANAVLRAETWNARTGKWTTGAAASVYRGYHSTATLLPDGVVLVAGGGIPGPITALNAQIYYPAYLFQAAGAGATLAQRPRIVSLSTITGAYGQPIDVQTATGDAIVEVSLIAAASVTHSFDMNQRRMTLAFAKTANGITVTMPASSNLTPPGYYTLATVNAAGVPSAGVIVALAASAPSSPAHADAAQSAAATQPARTLAPGTSIAFEPATWPGYLIRHQNYLGYIAKIDGKSDAGPRADASFIVRQGRGDASCYSFESASLPGYFLQHENFRVKLKPGDTGAVSLNGTTFCARAALNGNTDAAAMSFESLDWPGFYIRHRNFETWLVKFDATTAGADDSSFRTGSAGLVAAAAASLEPVSWPDYRIRHYDYVGYIAKIGANSPAIDKLDSSFTVRAGLADANCVSLESKNYPGYFLRHANFAIGLMRDDGGASRKDATFCPRAALNGVTDLGTVSLESLSMPGYYVRHKDFRVYIMQDDGTAAGKADAAFRVRAPLP